MTKDVGEDSKAPQEKRGWGREVEKGEDKVAKERRRLVREVKRG